MSSHLPTSDTPDRGTGEYPERQYGERLSDAERAQYYNNAQGLQAPFYPWGQGVLAPETEIETEPLLFHRLYRGVNGYSWWKPLCVALLFVSFYVILNIIIGFASVLWILLAQYHEINVSALTEISQTLSVLDTQKPESVAVALISVIAMIPAMWAACSIMGIRPFGRGLSVTLKIRWGFLGWCFLAAFVAQIFSIILGALLGESEQQTAVAQNLNMTNAMISAVLILCLMPLQATAEEYIFRGAMMQIFGSWVKHPAFAIGLSAVFFALLHPYDIAGKVMILLLGITAGYLTYRTGGLEAGIALHILNNALAFTVLVLGLNGQTSQVVDGQAVSWISVVVESFVLGIYVLLVELCYSRLVKQGKISRYRIDKIRVKR